MPWMLSYFEFFPQWRRYNANKVTNLLKDRRLKPSLVLLYAVLFLVSSCSDSFSNSAPLDEEKMVEVMSEIVVLEQYYQLKFGSPGVYKPALDTAADKVFKRLKVNRKDYEKSFDYYSMHPEQLKAIQEKVISALEEKVSK